MHNTNFAIPILQKQGASNRVCQKQQQQQHSSRTQQQQRVANLQKETRRSHVIKLGKWNENPSSLLK